jgi:hypothetical protein
LTEQDLELTPEDTIAAISMEESNKKQKTQ